MYYTPSDDGLQLPWFGTVFVNPPYSRQHTAHWIRKAMTEVLEGRARTVVALVAVRTDARWWHESIAGHADVFLLKGRLRFGGGKNRAPFPSALVVWGGREEHLTRLQTAFPEAWHVGPAGAFAQKPTVLTLDRDDTAMLSLQQAENGARCGVSDKTL